MRSRSVEISTDRNLTSAVRGGQVEHRAGRDDPGRVDALVGAVVVALDVVEVDGLRDPGHLVEVAQVRVQAGVVRDPPQVALEVAVVDGVEAHQRREQPPVGERLRVAHQVALAPEALVEHVERVEEREHGLLVGLLRGREAGPVDAVVERLVDALVELGHLVAQLERRVDALGVAREGLEALVEHLDHVGGLVVDDAAGRGVPQHRDADSAVEVRIGGVVGLGEVLPAVELVREGAVEAPTAIIADRVHDRHPDRVLEPLEVSQDDRPMRPWAGERDVQVVAARLGREARAAVDGHAVAEAAVLADEAPAGRLSRRSLIAHATSVPTPGRPASAGAPRVSQTAAPRRCSNASTSPLALAPAPASSLSSLPRTVTFTTLPISRRLISLESTASSGASLTSVLTSPPMPIPGVKWALGNRATLRPPVQRQQGIIRPLRWRSRRPRSPPPRAGPRAQPRTA